MTLNTLTSCVNLRLVHSSTILALGLKPAAALQKGGVNRYGRFVLVYWFIQLPRSRLPSLPTRRLRVGEACNDKLSDLPFVKDR